jgi:hypothetical protein
MCHCLECQRRTGAVFGARASLTAIGLAGRKSVQLISCALGERLQARGFIVPMKKGAFSLKRKHATEWRLTEFPCDMTHAPASKEFARWTPEIQNAVSLQTGMVSVAAPISTSNGTDVAEMSRNGA